MGISEGPSKSSQEGREENSTEGATLSPGKGWQEVKG